VDQRDGGQKEKNLPRGRKHNPLRKNVNGFVNNDLLKGVELEKGRGGVLQSGLEKGHIVPLLTASG